MANFLSIAYIDFSAGSSMLIFLILLLLLMLVCIIALAVLKKREKKGKETKKASPAVVFLIFGGLIGVGLYLADPSGFGATALAIGILLLVAALIAGIKKKKKATKADLTYDKYAKKLLLHRRTATNKRVLSLEEVQDYTEHYEPEKLVYTGATVGGVHTGGFHTAGGYHYTKPAATGKYQIRFDNTEISALITEIKLTDPKVVKKAQRDPFIQQFLSGDTLVLRHDAASQNDRKIKMAMEQNSPEAVMKFARQDYFRTLLTREECKKAIAWLCAEE